MKEARNGLTGEVCVTARGPLIFFFFNTKEARIYNYSSRGQCSIKTYLFFLSLFRSRSLIQFQEKNPKEKQVKTTGRVAVPKVRRRGKGRLYWWRWKALLRYATWHRRRFWNHKDLTHPITSCVITLMHFVHL